MKELLAEKPMKPAVLAGGACADRHQSASSATALIQGQPAKMCALAGAGRRALSWRPKHPLHAG